MSISVSEARSLIRKARRRVPEGESISHLNLTAMMDMMTILLVFMIKSASVQTTPLSIPVVLAPSTTTEPEPENAKTVTIAKNAILVEAVPVVGVKMVGSQLDVDPSEKTEGSFGIEIGKLKDRLSKHHQNLYFDSSGQEPRHELIIVADKEIPFRLLYTVLYTAGQAKASGHLNDPKAPGFNRFRLIVLRTTE